MNKDVRFAILTLVVLAGCGGDDKTNIGPPRTPSSSAGDFVSGAGGLGARDPRSKDSPSGDKSNAKKKKGQTVAKAEPPRIRPEFLDVAAEVGIDFTFFNDSVPDRFFLPEVMGGGAGWIDFDGDGLLDLYFANGAPLKDPDPRQVEHVSQVYRNLGGDRFVRVTDSARATHNGFGQGLSVGDYDADGFPDLFYSCYGPDVLFHNNGDGTFDAVTAQAGTSDDEWSSGSAWFDADADGDLDLYVVNYIDVRFENHRVCDYQGKLGYCGPGEYAATADRLYVNQGDGTFVESLEEFGLTGENGKGLAVSVLDLDDDLRPEIYVANDMTANFLFTQSDWYRASVTPDGARPAARGPRSTDSASRRHRYQEIGLAAGCALSNMGFNEASMGISSADFDGDGLTDLYLTHFLNAKNTLYRNMGKLSFIDDSFKSRAAATSFQSLGFGTVPIDYDRDGAPDLFVANGHVLGPNVVPYAMKPQLLRNDGAGRLFDVSEFSGGYFAERWVGRSAALADFDNDGDLDVAVTHLQRPSALLRNDTRTERRFLGLTLRRRDRVPPVGGRVRVVTKQGTRVLPIQAGGSYLATADARLVFACEEEPPLVEIHWPSGEVQKLESLTTDRYWLIYEGEAPMLDPSLAFEGAS